MMSTTNQAIPFQVTDWQKLPTSEHSGSTGIAYWRSMHFGGLRVRLVEYSAGYLADHWCQKGHILLVLEGAIQTELADGRVFTMTAGMSYEVSDNQSSHRSFTEQGAKLFIVDGTFLDQSVSDIEPL